MEELLAGSELERLKEGAIIPGLIMEFVKMKSSLT